MMTDQEWKAILSLRGKGYAVAFFTPEELGIVPTHTAQDWMTEGAADRIDSANTSETAT